MDGPSDSDDSAFLNLPKRKAQCNDSNQTKKLRLEPQAETTLSNDIQREANIDTRESKDDSVCQNVNKMLEPYAEIKTSNERLSGDNEIIGKLISHNVDNYFSCPLCLKILHSESAHFSHMKQCAKKSKMSAKQLLEALQLHKKHLKERIIAGLSNIPAKTKKIQVQKEKEDSTYQLAIGLALSKSLEDGVGSKENENIPGSVNYHTGNKTLENFGFTSFGKPSIGVGKKSKNSKLGRSVLKKRTAEDREKLLTEKASIVLLINDDTIITEAQKSLRVYHCKHLEQNRDKDSYLWKLGENIEETQWYVERLRNVILEDNGKVEDRNLSVVHEQCNIDEKITKLNLPRSTFFEDWRRLVNNKHFSDLILNTKDNKTLYLHSVVIYARCPKILDSDLKTIAYKFDSCIFLKCLQYLYCGSLDGLVHQEVDYLLSLAESLGYQELEEVLRRLKESLSGERCSRIDRKSSAPEMDNWCELVHPSPSCLEERSSGSTLPKEQDVITSNDTEEESKEEKEITAELHGRSSKPECEAVEQDKEACSTEDQSEMDMFEEVENLNKSVARNDDDCGKAPENELECIEISSGSIKSDVTLIDNKESEKILSDLDYDIPYFDPYEHFNSDIPETVTEEQVESQSLITRDFSPVISGTPICADPMILDMSPCVVAPDLCSTPNSEVPRPSTSTQLDLSNCSDRPVKKSRYSTPCSKLIKKSRKLIGSKSQKKQRKTKSSRHEENSEKVACVLTESILRELDKSMGTAATEPSPKEELNYVEVTPKVSEEEFVDDVSPIPDYSVMGASSIKKHLAKYGLKKSLSKNKAKKILRHIYEELHPILDVKNRKIVKYIQKEKPKVKKGGKGKRRSKKSTSTEKERSKDQVQRTLPTTSIKRKSKSSSVSPRLAPPKTAVEEEGRSCTSTDSCDGESLCESQDDGNCLEEEEPLSQASYISGKDAPTALLDFIYNNPDIHRQILMYEPIWLEELQRKLFEKYNKKFKLTDLMDCLDAECITFRCERQTRQNKRRK